MKFSYHWMAVVLLLLGSYSCTDKSQVIALSHGVDESAGGVSVYIISSLNSTYFLEKEGGGLSSILDKEGIDWLGFHNKKGSGHKGEYRGFPNAIHKQDGSYFHAMNAGTDPSSSVIEIETDQHIRIIFTSDNKQWEGQWDFYPDRCDFTMNKISEGHHYWVQYEGVPGGEMDSTDYWFASANEKKNLINQSFIGDLPAPEWMAFGDKDSPRVLYMLHHEDDDYSDNYVSRPDMTVLGFGRMNKEKFLDTKQTFSIGFVESIEYDRIENYIKEILIESK